MITYLKILCDRFMVLRYLISGGVGALLHLGLLYVFTDFFGIWYLLSSLMGFVCAAVVSFLLQKWWTFADKNNNSIHRQFFYYTFVTGTSLLLNAAILYILVEYIELWYLLSQIITSGFLAITTFFVYKKILFKSGILDNNSIIKHGDSDTELLIITQVVDAAHPVLGFFHGWLNEFAQHFKKITVICLQRGEYHLPSNVKVLSLGKEGGYSRCRYMMRFYKYIWQEKNNYDAVFVHMNQEYVLLGGLIWRWLGKNIFLWRNHAHGGWLTNVAVFFSHQVFYTSPQSYTARFKKSNIMPVGIDTELFKPSVSTNKKPHSIIFLGRIAPIKNVDVFVDTLKILNDEGIDFSATIAGSALPQDRDYEELIRQKANGLASFVGSVSQIEAVRLYQRHEIYINLTPAGSMDKTIFEAMACGITPLVFNDGLKILDKEFIVEKLDPKHLADKIIKVFDGRAKSNFRGAVVADHSLKCLTSRLLATIN